MTYYQLRPWPVKPKSIERSKMERNKQEERIASKHISELAGALQDPIVVYPGGWGDTLPPWLKEAIQVERVIMNLKEVRGQQPTGTDAEACAYLYTACLNFPFDRDWTEIYLYVATQVYTNHHTGSNGDAPIVPQDIKVESLNEQQMSDLLRLKNWIHRKRVEGRQAKDRDERRRQRQEAAAKKKREQPSLFDFQNKGGVYVEKAQVR